MANAIMTDKLGGSDTANGTLNDVTDVVKTYEVIADTIRTKNYDPMNFGAQGSSPFKAGTSLVWTSPIADIASMSTSLTFKSQSGYVKGTTGTYTYESEDIVLDANANIIYAEVLYDVWTVFDECDDSSLSATTFPTSTNCTEGTNGISGDSASGTTLTSADLSSYAIINFRYANNCASFTASANSVTRFTDGSSTSTLASVGSETDAQQTQAGEVTVFLDWTAKLAYVVHEYYRTSIDGSGVGSINETYRDTIYKTQRIDLTGWTSFKIEQTTSATAGSTSTLYYVRVGNTNPSTTATVSVSADAGSNYDTTVNGIATAVTTAGTSVRAKLTGTVAANEVVVIKGVKIKKVS